MKNARALVDAVMQGVDYEKKRNIWSFLNTVLMGLSPNTTLSSVQENLFFGVLQSFATGMDSLPDNNNTKLALAINLAAWANGVYVANNQN